MQQFFRKNLIWSGDRGKRQYHSCGMFLSFKTAIYHNYHPTNKSTTANCAVCCLLNVFGKVKNEKDKFDFFVAVLHYIVIITHLNLPSFCVLSRP